MLIAMFWGPPHLPAPCAEYHHPEHCFPLQGTAYYVQVSAYNMKGWGPPQASVPPFAIPSSKYSTQLRDGAGGGASGMRC